ncbi:alpha/beta hydrolase [Pigmentiphaga soli]|uniref:Alpha/beta hydrolase n=1 Tax=Pigmentiphaga soli TaxID=1007095 RepID=A0ABP8HS71_9BURK
MKPLAKRFAKVGDLDIHYEFADYTDPWQPGEPETFLLYPGYCRNTEFWRAWSPLLGRHYRVLSLDARGYGDTTKPAPGSPLSPEMLAGDAIGLLDALGIERAHWVGESTGGALGLVAALEHPDRISSITLLNTAAKMGDETISTYALGEADQAAAIEKYGVAEWCRRTLQYRMDLSKAPPGLAEWVPAQMARTPDYMAIAAFRLFSTVDLTPRLPEIKAPTLLIVGSKCTERRLRHMAEMRDLLPTAKLVKLEGYDYGIHFLAPDAVVAEIRTFLEEQR